MTSRFYRSTDTSAPVLTGQVGTLLTVLDAILVNGYGSQTAAGWTKPFVNSGNIGCYKNSAVDGTGFHVNINDNGPGGGGAKEARLTGFETMSALSTGTGQFPTLSQVAIGIGALVGRKSATADATARPWYCVADDTVFHLFIETGDATAPTGVFSISFGDIFAYKTNDAYRCLLMGRISENTSFGSNEAMLAIVAQGATGALSTTLSGHYMPRHWTGVGGSINVGKNVDTRGNPTQLGVLSSVSNFPYPNGPDGGLFMSPMWAQHNNAIRGYLKGLWHPCHTQPLNHADTFSGTGSLAGKSFIALNLANGAGTAGAQIMVETSDTWS